MAPSGISDYPAEPSSVNPGARWAGCYNGHMRSLIPLLVGAAIYAAFFGVTSAAAQSAFEPLPLSAAPARGIPAEAHRGVMQRPMQGLATIDGTQLLMAPGVQIRDTHNRIVLSDSLAQAHLVKYMTDAQGQLFRVWILTAAEAVQP